MVSVGDRVVVRLRDRSSPPMWTRYDGVTGVVIRIGGDEEGRYVVVKPDLECVTPERPCGLERWTFYEHRFDVQPEHSPADVLPDRDWS